VYEREKERERERARERERRRERERERECVDQPWLLSFFWLRRRERVASPALPKGRGRV
jgi:hypothetical protein